MAMSTTVLAQVVSRQASKTKLSPMEGGYPVAPRLPVAHREDALRVAKGARSGWGLTTEFLKVEDCALLCMLLKLAGGTLKEFKSSFIFGG